MDTIFALSSGSLPSGVAVVRVSGRHARTIGERLTGKTLKPRMMTFSAIRAGDGQVVDYGLTVYFNRPNSFTGEDCVEFHIHGGKAVVDRLMRELQSFSGCRLAEAGEFARRAFANGKLDLTAAEGLADLIDAETESQRRLAITGASGALANKMKTWRQQLIEQRALLEAELDFSDEQDVRLSLKNDERANLVRLKEVIDSDIRAGERLASMREGVKLVLVGAPNTGKSSLINRIAGRDIAIVTEQPGTTRDALETTIIINGVAVTVTDTAGLRTAEDTIERLGITTALERVESADIIWFIEDMTAADPWSDPSLALVLNKHRDRIWRIGNKLDVAGGDLTRWPYRISAKTGEGINDLLAELQNVIAEQYSSLISRMVPARRRQIQHLKACRDALRDALDDSQEAEIIAEHLRRASNELGRITGEIDVEDLLDVIFSQFCIGK